MTLEVRYLRDGVWAKGDGVPWPPAPGLLFAALVQAWGTGGEDGREEEALRWLEATPPPGISAPRLGPPTLHRTFVPVNSAKREDYRPQSRKRYPLRLASAFFQGEPVVAYHLGEEPPPHLLAPLEALAARVSRLGNSLNPVEVRLVRLVEDTGEPDWVPAEPPGEATLGVWYPGYLEALKARHFRVHGIPRGTSRTFPGGRWEPLPVRYQAYRLKASEKAYPRPFQAVLALEPGLPLPYWYPLAQRLQEQLPEEGVLLLPLSFVGHPRADGRVLGIGVVLEEGRAFYEFLPHLLALLEGQVLLPPPWRSRLRFGEASGRASLRPERWTRPARRWASVTPVVWPRTGGRMEEALVRLAEEQGLPRPSAVQAGPYPYLKGVPEVRAFLPYLPFPEGKYRAAHLRLEFPHPVPGPLALGEEREVGLGFLAPLDGPEERA